MHQFPVEAVLTILGLMYDAAAARPPGTVDSLFAISFDSIEKDADSDWSHIFATMAPFRIPMRLDDSGVLKWADRAMVKLDSLESGALTLVTHSRADARRPRSLVQYEFSAAAQRCGFSIFGSFWISRIGWGCYCNDPLCRVAGPRPLEELEAHLDAMDAAAAKRSSTS